MAPTKVLIKDPCPFCGSPETLTVAHMAEGRFLYSYMRGSVLSERPTEPTDQSPPNGLLSRKIN